MLVNEFKIVSDDKFWQLRKALSPMLVTDSGIVSDDKILQS